MVEVAVERVWVDRGLLGSCLNHVFPLISCWWVSQIWFPAYAWKIILLPARWLRWGSISLQWATATLPKPQKIPPPPSLLEEGPRITSSLFSFYKGRWERALESNRIEVSVGRSVYNTFYYWGNNIIQFLQLTLAATTLIKSWFHTLRLTLASNDIAVQEKWLGLVAGWKNAKKIEEE